MTALGHSVSSSLARRIGLDDFREPIAAKFVAPDGKLTYYERWIIAFANILFQKQILTPKELARKMDEVEARWSPNLAKGRAERIQGTW